MRSSSQLTSMKLIVIPNCSLLYSNDKNSNYTPEVALDEDVHNGEGQVLTGHGQEGEDNIVQALIVVQLFVLC